MTTLDLINEKLERICTKSDMREACYGAGTDDEKKKWNHFVFFKRKSKRSGTKNTELQHYYNVCIVHENYIPEGFLEQVIEELQTEESGMKLKVTEDDVEYDYAFKGKTKLVVEIATLVVTKPRKGGI